MDKVYDAYKWMDAQEVKPKERPSGIEAEFQKKILQKQLDFIDML